jgi:hypothetical protein
MVIPSDELVTAFPLAGAAGKAGFTPLWRANVFSSEMSFAGFQSDSGMVAFNERSDERMRQRLGAADLLRREFSLRGVTIVC